MTDSQSNVRLRAAAGTPTTGVIHVRTRLTAHFTVISNALAQRRGSAVTVGVAAYILSLPDGSPVSIAALCAHFTEGEILISRALRDLEEAGYLERRRERTPAGQIRTRTYFRDVPGSGRPDGPPEPPRPPRPREPGRPGPAETAATRTNAPNAPNVTHSLAQVAVEASGTRAEPPVTRAEADPEAVAVLGALRRIDPRLILSRQRAVRRPTRCDTTGSSARGPHGLVAPQRPAGSQRCLAPGSHRAGTVSICLSTRRPLIRKGSGIVR